MKFRNTIIAALAATSLNTGACNDEEVDTPIDRIEYKTPAQKPETTKTQDTATTDDVRIKVAKEAQKATTIIDLPETTEMPDNKIHDKMLQSSETPLYGLINHPLPAAVKDYISSKNKAHHNYKVLEWMRANQAEWIHTDRAGNMGYHSNELEEVAKKLLAEGKLTDMSGEGIPEAYFNPYDQGDEHGSGVKQEYRRVIRTQDVPYLQELYEKLNFILHRYGMDKDITVTPVINSSIRSIEHNDRLRKSSKQSLHLSFSALDLNERYFILNTTDSDGSTTRETAMANESYRTALTLATHQMGLEGKVFVRFHAGHWHILFKSISNLAPSAHTTPAPEHAEKKPKSECSSFRHLGQCS